MIRFRAARRALDDSGQALVEFALVVPILVVLIIGVFEFSRAWEAQHILAQTAREALRSAVVDDPTYSQETMFGQIRAALERGSLDPSKADVQLTGWKTGTGTPARIAISYHYEFFLLEPFVEWVNAGDDVTLSASFVMRNE